jgi:tetratricopeptide (TPR) repeat protein
MPMAPRPRAVVASLAAMLVGAGCSGGATQPEPTPLSKEAALVDPPKRPERKGPFRNPNVDPPAPRGGAQVPAAQIEAALAESKTLADAGEINRAMLALLPCHNKEPASVRCDGEMAILMLQLGTRKAHGRHFIDEAARMDDPEADADFYRRLAATAKKHGRHDTAASALAKVLAREPGGAADWLALSRALQTDGARLEEAIAALDKVLELDPSTPADVRFERAVLIAQTDDEPRAIAAFEAFLQAAPEGDPSIAMAKERIAELKSTMARPSEPEDTKAPTPAPPVPEPLDTSVKAPAQTKAPGKAAP